MKTFWTTFYSYKGGVGRSLALANVAALLVKRGRRVVLIDFDLEAPGLDSFPEFSPCSGKAGVVEYVAEFTSTRRAPDISAYVHPCILPECPRGSLWVMPAGRKDKVYNQLRENIDWIHLYDLGVGSLFVENWKASIENKFKPDYVFIDSRTGVTDIGGICTLHMPDAVVLLFGLNDQNLTGISAVADVLRNNAKSKSLRLLPVATPIPNSSLDDNGLVKKRLDKAEKLLKLKISLHITYSPMAALEEQLYVLKGDMNLIDDEYMELMHGCVELNRTGLDFLITTAEEHCDRFDERGALKIASILEDEFVDRPEALYWIARIKRTFGALKQAVEFAKAAALLDPAYDEALELLEELLQKQPEKMLAFVAEIIKKSEVLDQVTLVALYAIRAKVAMRSGKFKDAWDAYSFILGSESGESTLSQLVGMFNVAEAERRAMSSSNVERWRSVIKLFERRSLKDGNAFPEMSANHQQAMHIAFACIGDLNRARKCLQEAEKSASDVSIADDIFCVKTYTEVSKSEFLKANREMMNALNRGELWDGMKLRSESVDDKKRILKVRRRIKPK